MLPELRVLYFEDLAVGLSEDLHKVISSSDVVGFAEVTGAVVSGDHNRPKRAPRRIVERRDRFPTGRAPRHDFGSVMSHFAAASDLPKRLDHLRQPIERETLPVCALCHKQVSASENSRFEKWRSASPP